MKFLLFLLISFNLFATDCLQNQASNENFELFKKLIEKTDKNHFTSEDYRNFTSKQLAEYIVEKIKYRCKKYINDDDANIGKSSDIMMWVPNEIVDQIAQYGFMNQHTTKSTKGCECTDKRLTVEQGISNIGHGYSSKAIDVLPKYAGLSVSKEFLNEKNIINMEPKPYGDIVFVFKKDIYKRATWTTTDSLLAEQQGKHFSSTKKTGCDYYCETQIWGDLDLRDVAYVLMNKDSKIPQSLIDMKIPIYEKVSSDNFSSKIEKGNLIQNGNNEIEKRRPKVLNYSKADLENKLNGPSLPDAERNVLNHFYLTKLNFEELKKEFEKNSNNISKQLEYLGEMIERENPELKKFLLEKDFSSNEMLQSRKMQGLENFIGDNGEVDQFFATYLDQNRFSCDDNKFTFLAIAKENTSLKKVLEKKYNSLLKIL